MLRKTLFLALAAMLGTLLTCTDASAYGCYHYSHHASGGGGYHYNTPRLGAAGGGAYHYGGYGAGSVYHYGAYSAVGGGPYPYGYHRR